GCLTGRRSERWSDRPVLRVVVRGSHDLAGSYPAQERGRRRSAQFAAGTCPGVNPRAPTTARCPSHHPLQAPTRPLDTVSAGGIGVSVPFRYYLRSAVKPAVSSSSGSSTTLSCSFGSVRAMTAMHGSV